MRSHRCPLYCKELGKLCDRPQKDPGAPMVGIYRAMGTPDLDASKHQISVPGGLA